MIYAIDFGTTNSLLGAVIDGKSHPPIPLDPHARDSTILRSVLFFEDRTKCFFGAEAVKEFVRHDMEGRFIRSIKKFLPMQSFHGTQIGNRTVSIEDIIATFLREMRLRADKHFGKEVKRVLLGRPAKFSADPKEDAFAEDRLAAAAKIAGFEEVSFCPEPIAAAYEFKTHLKEEKIVLVCDFGGGTSDFTVMKLSPRKYENKDVLSIGGLSLAGDAFDGSLMRKRIAKHFGSEVQYMAPFGSNIHTMPQHLMEKICSPADISLLRERDTLEFFRNVKNWSLGGDDKKHMDQLFDLIHEQIGFELFEEIERTKRAISQKMQEEFSFLHASVKIKETITRQNFTDYSAEIVSRILLTLDQTIKDAGIQESDIDIVYSTGGTAKVPAIQEALLHRFGKEKLQEQNHFHSIVSGLINMAADRGEP